MDSYEKGDHLYTFCTGYTHHALYVGSGYVIQRTREGVKRSTLYSFSEGSSIFKEDHIWRPFTREQSCERAYSELGNPDYNVFWNNCEQFVNWTISGFAVSSQVLAPLGIVNPAIFFTILSNYVGTKVLPTSLIKILAENPVTQNDVTQTTAENPKTAIVAGVTTTVIAGLTLPVATTATGAMLALSALGGAFIGGGYVACKIKNWITDEFF